MILYHADWRGKLASDLDTNGAYGNYINHIWEAVTQDNLEKTYKILNNKIYSVNAKSFRLKNTPLHCAVMAEKEKQVNLSFDLLSRFVYFLNLVRIKRFKMVKD
jgi:hypothetical protein